jgi:hypothetical protein
MQSADTLARACGSGRLVRLSSLAPSASAALDRETLGVVNRGTVAARVTARVQLGVAMVVVALAAIVLSTTAPVPEISGDTVPGRVGAAVLRCAGTFDLRRLDWVKREADESSTYYYMWPDKTGAYTSIFGPGPAVVGAVALVDFDAGDRLGDIDLRKRERLAAAFLVALAGALIVLAAGVRCTPARAGLTGLVAVASFAGAATMGQGLWQATTALPFLAAALATLAWREPSRRLASLAAVPDAGAARRFGHVAADHRSARRRARSRVAPACPPSHAARLVAAVVLVLAATAPLVVWNAIHLNSPFPIGQWKANKRMNEGSVFSIAHVANGIAGLVASPGRGLVWFAPIACVGFVRGVRPHPSAPDHPWRLAAVGMLLQLIAMALFFKWHGGQAFGPRLLAETTWVATFLALGTRIDDRARHLATAAAVVTCMVGLVGLYAWRPQQWELRRVPDVHADALWDFADSPLSAIFVYRHHRAGGHDAPPTHGVECRADGTLRSF